MIKLSFIIPFYNGGKYIIECLDSLYAQDIQDSEFEVIVVDDCSSRAEDVAMLERYSSEHPPVRVLHNERNLRCGGSRNNGLRHARGEYVWFVDQDDYIAPNCCGRILELCSKHELDILYFDFRDVSDDLSLNQKRGVVKKISDVKAGLDYIQEDCEGDFWQSGYDTNVWHAVYRREYMHGNKIYSPEVSYCEDMIVAQHAIIVAKRFMAIPNDYYCYRYNPSSVFHTEVGVNGRPLFDSSIYAGSELVKLSELIPLEYETLRDCVKEGGVYRLNKFSKSLLKINGTQRDAFYKTMHAHEEIVGNVMVYMKPINKWLVSHERIVKMMPHIIYAYIKLFKIA